METLQYLALSAAIVFFGLFDVLILGWLWCAVADARRDRRDTKLVDELARAKGLLRCANAALAEATARFEGRPV